MYKTSNRYKELIYNKKHLLNIYIDGAKVEAKYIIDFKCSQTLLADDEFCLGSTPAREIKFTIHKSALPKSYKDFYIETGVRLRSKVFNVLDAHKSTVGAINKSPLNMFSKQLELIPFGHFRLEEIAKENDYTVTIKAIDNMIKFEFNYDGSKLKYPCTVLEVLQDICLKAEVELRFYFFFKLRQTNSCVR